MGVFFSTLNQTAVLFLLILAGLIACKRKLLPENAGVVLAKLETYILIPALSIHTFMTRFTLENLSTRWQSILCSSLLLLAAVVIALLLARLFAPAGYARRIYQYSFVVANLGFMGNAVIQGVFGGDMLFDYLIFTLPMSIFVQTVGVAWLIPGQSSKISFKALLSPMFIALLIGAILGLTGIKLPSFLETALASATACMSPIAMLLTGFIIGGFQLKRLLSNKRVYWAAAFRLLIIPTILAGSIKLLGFSGSILACALCAHCLPMGLNTVIIPSSYGGDTELGASIALTSHLLSIITIPVMFALFLGGVLL